MKDSYLILLVGLGAAFYLSKQTATPTGTTKPTSSTGGGAQEITYGTPNGWRYFTDGTAISPDGTYYKNGEMVWNPMM